jgi:hypothetical protein
MEAIMNARILYVGLPLAVTLLSAGAYAQTVVTDRPLQLTQNQQTTVYRTIVRENVVPQTRPSVRKQSSKQTVRQTVRNGKVVRTTTTERIVTRPAPVARQRVIAPLATDVVVGAPLDLTQDQQTILYRTLVQQPMRPAPVVTERIMPAPGTRPFVTSEPDTVVTTDPYGRRMITVPETTGAGTITFDESGANIVIGSRIPASVPLYVMPAETAAAVPSMQGYRYALVGDRVYLVDPRDGIVVAMLYQ